jgi:Predicted membrane protein (DUF2142)
MRRHEIVSSLRSRLEGLRSSDRRVWLTSFVVVSLLTALWAVANPLYAGPDEPAHVIRAVALDHGQLTGKSLTPRVRKELGNARKDHLIVRVPAVYGLASTSICFSYEPNVTASCLDFDEPTREVDDLTYVARHPPAYYAVVGAVSWVYTPGSGTVYLMRFLGVLMTGALIATAIFAVRRSAAPRIAAAGLVFAVTPMVLFVGSVVNPSGPEIAASVAVWACGLVLVSQAHERVDNRLVTGAGIAACVLALSRQLGPLWLGLIALTLLAVANRAALCNLARSNCARLWTFLIVAFSLAQVAWAVIFEPLDVTLSEQEPADIETAELIRVTLGATIPRYRDMIGTFGWLDTPSPAVTWIPWTVGIAFLFFGALLWANRRFAASLLGLLGAVIIVPVVLESATYRDAGGFSWQGRYTLPLAVGVPILAAMALASTARGRQVVTPRLLVVIGVVAGVGHIFAYAQNLRRYTVGYDGPIQFWKGAEWAPPTSPLLLSVAYALAVSAFVFWLFVGVPKASHEGEQPLAIEDPERSITRA